MQDYDAIQLAAVLVICDQCQQSYYMTGKDRTTCIKCRQKAQKETKKS